MSLLREVAELKLGWLLGVVQHGGIFLGFD